MVPPKIYIPLIHCQQTYVGGAKLILWIGLAVKCARPGACTVQCCSWLSPLELDFRRRFLAGCISSFPETPSPRLPLFSRMEIGSRSETSRSLTSVGVSVPGA